MKPKTINIMGWILSLIVLLLFYFVIMVLENPVNLIFTGKSATGTVVGIQIRDSLSSPIVQFTTLTGKQVKVIGRSYSKSAGAVIGEEVNVLYELKNPKNAQLMMWREFYILVFLLGFIAFIVMVWFCCFLVSPQYGFDDPLHILSKSVTYFHLSPWRLPLFFILFCAISFTGIGSYVTFKSGFNLRNNGIKVPGLVVDTKWSVQRVERGSVYKPAEFVMITYMDLSGKKYTVPRSLTKPLSRLKEGDRVEMIYPPKQPSQGVVNTWDEIYLVPTILTFMFICFCAMLWLLWRGKIQLPE